MRNLLFPLLAATAFNAHAGDDNHCHPMPDSAEYAIGTDGSVQVIKGAEELERLGYEIDNFRAVLNPFPGQKTDVLIAVLHGSHVDVGAFTQETMGPRLNGYEITPCREDLKKRLKEMGLIN